MEDTTEVSDRPFERRQSDVNYSALNTRLTALEDFVHEEIKPGLDSNTSMTADIHAKNDEMYAAYIVARNGVRLLGKIGDGVMYVSDHVEKRPKTLLILGFLAAAGYSFVTTGKLPDWLTGVVRVLVS